VDVNISKKRDIVQLHAHYYVSVVSKVSVSYSWVAGFSEKVIE